MKLTFRSFLALVTASGALASGAAFSAEPAETTSHPPYFNFKARQFLIEGSHAIAPLAPIPVGRTRQLMLDRHVIDDAWGCERTVHPAEKHPRNPVLAGRPQFGAVHFGSSFLFDPDRGRYRLWACSWNTARPEHQLGLFHAYYESPDGLTWEAPKLGLVDYDGSRAHNVLQAAPGVEYHSASVQPVPPRLQTRGRYVMLYSFVHEPPPPGTTHGMEQRIAWSDDGLRWRDQPENPVFRGRSDTFNNILYNPDRDVFMLYRRPSVNANQIRRVAYSESRDLIQWTQPQTILFPDESDPATMFYSHVVVRYQGMYLGFLQNFYLYADDPNRGGLRDGPKSHQLDLELAWSRDGRRWERHPRHPVFLATGLPGSHDAGMVYLHQGLHEADGRVWLLYSGHEARHVTAHVKQGRGSSLCLASVRQDGFVSLDARRDGYVLTKPLRIAGRRLHLNAQTEPGGFIRVAVRRGDGVNDGDWIEGWNFDDGGRFTGDSLDAVLEWKGGDSLEALQDRAPRLHFWLHRARLYSFWFE
ncbi:MAG: exo-alpha-sialidase [Verrucomicrobia bacterium]|nr:exo-alpha-sialidase [Verrucomicrobiota bacterium]